MDYVFISGAEHDPPFYIRLRVSWAGSREYCILYIYLSVLVEVCLV